jgi:hypothetical protein
VAKIGFYLSEEEKAWVKEQGPSFLRGLVQEVMDSTPRSGDPGTIEDAIVLQKEINKAMSKNSHAIDMPLEISGVKECPRCHTLIPEKATMHGKCGWKEKP